MKTLEVIYWLRLVLGITTAFICIGYGLATDTIKQNAQYTIFFNGLSIALVIYMISYYLIKSRPSLRVVEKPKKLLTTGIGIYFISWMVFWTLLYTIISVPTAGV